MVKKTEAKVEAKTLKVKLMDAVSRVLKTNKSSMTGKMEALLKKSVKRISRRAKKQFKKGKLALAKA
jgi:ribosomal protein RSM22 (predicted rRNA methylase)